MAASDNRTKSQAMAAYLAKHSPKRTHSACPHHCGAMVAVGGHALTSHLNVCKGTHRVNGGKHR